ncbi:hypothetical protein FRC18_002760 [Serendipita sp. 400]|nr:hypothetical protein FRC18_002760 [Serendipita sp. 400]
MANAWPPPSPLQLTSKLTDIYFHCFHSGSGGRADDKPGPPSKRGGGGGTWRNSIVRTYHSSADDTKTRPLIFYSSYSNLNMGPIGCRRNP